MLVEASCVLYPPFLFYPRPPSLRTNIRPTFKPTIKLPPTTAPTPQTTPRFRIRISPRILTNSPLPVKLDPRRIPLLNADQEITHSEQRPRAHGARARPLVLDGTGPVHGPEEDAVEGFGASALDDVDAAAAG